MHHQSGHSLRRHLPAAGKATIVNLLGVPQARARLGELVSEASDALSVFGAKRTVLAAAAKFVAERQA